MSEKSFISRIINNEYLVADGATGSNLIARGLPSGITAETWVLEQPEQIIQLHRDFISAGAEIILTSTFGASSIRLIGSILEGKADYINRKAVELAQNASIGTKTYIAGSLGPVGQLLKPYGPLTIGEVQDAYAEQARAISEAGADLLVIETQFDMGEIKAAIHGARSVSALPLVISLSYDRGKRTMMGVSPAQAGKELEGLPVDIIGINCGRSLEENLQNLVDLRQVTKKSIWFKPNAGLPHIDSQGKTVYEITPEVMGEQVHSWLEAGAQIVGGCCGTSPDHLKEISKHVQPNNQGKLSMMTVK
jgi:5-methyltetrahydrofolate--homocysteine methyltransferase